MWSRAVEEIQVGEDSVEVQKEKVIWKGLHQKIESYLARHVTASFTSLHGLASCRLWQMKRIRFSLLWDGPKD